MRVGSAKPRRERGQVLVLGVLVMVVLLGFTALAVDVGFFLRHRALVQQAVDAAALAGAQELPGSQVAAEQAAKEYAQKNGVDPDTVQVEFRCTSSYTIACDPSQDKWDTIQVSGQLDVPFFFAPVLSLAGAEGQCFLGTCPVVNSAAGCRGACGGVPNVPVDAVMILDRTGSMTNSDLANAKNAAETLLETFDPDFHRAGLAVLGAGYSYNNPCQDGLPGIWLPVALDNDFQTPSGELNNGSRMVDTINCLVHSSQGTNLGNPIEAAVAELQANGRPDIIHGLILLTDGAANEPQADDSTSWHNCGSDQPVTSGAGDNDGFEVYSDDACSNGGTYARDYNSGTNTNVSCTDSGKDQHVFYDYGISVPAGSTITGIEVRADVAVSSSYGTNGFCVELSWDGGNSWTSTNHNTGDVNNYWTTRYMGSSSDTWGRSWTSDDLANGNFMIRVTTVGSNSSRDFGLDWITPRVYYQAGYGGPCEYAAQQADIAKSLDIEVYTIGYGVDSGDTCNDDSGYWGGKTAEDLLRYIATDDDHFFLEAQGEDLAPIFQVIAQQLASGSRLVPVN